MVYLHRKKTDDSVFYVGMGSIKRAYVNANRGNWWNGVVNKYGYYVQIYKENLSKEEAFELEIELIEKYGRIDIGTGCLINQTSGGPLFCRLSYSSMISKSKSLKSVNRTKEWNNKISKALKGKTKNKEWRDKLSKAQTGKKMSESTREKMRISNKSKIITAKKISCYDYLSGDFICNFESIRIASSELNCLETAISNNLHGRTKYVFSKALSKKIKIKEI